VALASCQRAKPATTPAPARPTAGVPTTGVPTTAPGAPNGATFPGLAGMLGAGAPGEPSPRPYGMVITPGARTAHGLLTTHQLRGRLYFEIPASQLGRDMLIVRSLRGSQQPIGGIPGTTLAGSRLVRWERRENRILLRGANYQNVVGDTTNAIARALDIIAYAPIIAAFNVESYGRDSAAVIEVTRVFLGGVSDLIQSPIPTPPPDPTRSFIERVATFDKNVEIEASQTFAASPLGGGPPTRWPRCSAARRRAAPRCTTSRSCACPTCRCSRARTTSASASSTRRRRTSARASSASRAARSPTGGAWSARTAGRARCACRAGRSPTTSTRPPRPGWCRG
jgi:hypothetical protein